MENAARVFADLVVALRTAASLTQEALAERSGLSVRAIREIERGRVHLPRASSVDLLADALNLAGEQRRAFSETARGTTDLGRSLSLPGANGPLIGRELMLDELAVRIAAARSARLVIAGLGGVGKTAFAIALAHRLQDAFPGGALFLDLCGLSSPLSPVDVLRRVVASLDGRPVLVDDVDVLRARFRSSAAERSVLLVLDNAHDEGQVRALMPDEGEPFATVVTCRRPLAGLDRAELRVLDTLDRDASVRLLADRVGAERSSDPIAVGEVAEACGDLPLALRVAAAKLSSRPMWTMRDLAAKLRAERRRLDVLRAGDLDVRASMELTFRSLSAPARAALGRVAVCGVSSLPDWLVSALAGLADDELPRVLDELVDACLLDSLGFDRTGCERYALHDLVRIFAAEAVDPDDRAAAMHRAADAMTPIAIAVDAASELLTVGPAGPAWFRHAAEKGAGDTATSTARLDQDYRTALEVIRGGRPDDVWELAAALASYQMRYSHLDDWVRTHRTLLGPVTDPLAERLLSVSLGHALLCGGDLDAAEAAFRTAAELALAAADETSAAYAQVGLGGVLQVRGDLGRARDVLSAAADQARAAEDMHVVGEALVRLCQVVRESGEPRAALAILAENADVLAAGRPIMRPYWLHESALCRIALGDLPEAEAELREALEIFEREGWPVWQGAVLRALARVYRAAGRLEDALAVLEQARACFAGVGEQRWEGWVLLGIAELHVEVGQPADAERQLAAGVAILDAIGDANGLQRAAAVRATLPGAVVPAS